MGEDTVLRGRRILVVEDDAMISMMVVDMLFDLGCDVVGPANSLSEALALALGDGAIDAAFLDVNLGGVSVFPLADALRARGVPVVFATGYGAGALRDEDRGATVVRKPYRAHELEAALRAALGQAS